MPRAVEGRDTWGEMRTIGQSDCRMCGKALSILRRLSGSEFCTPSHKTAFLREQEELGLARLLEWKPPSFNDDSPAGDPCA